jgi:hypothetical protein
MKNGVIQFSQRGAVVVSVLKLVVLTSSFECEDYDTTLV